LARFPKISPAVKKRAAQIKILLMDVDGTMTDGGVTLLSQTDGSALEPWRRPPGCAPVALLVAKVLHCSAAPMK